MGKKLKAVKEALDQNKIYPISDAVSTLKNSSFTKFDETFDIVMNLGVDPRHSDQMIRGVVSLPAGTGKDVKVAVICKSDKDEVAKKAGADFVGADDIIENIQAGKIDFDICIATPDMMAVIGRVARILGPKGLMPNPKLGTVTTDIEGAVKKAKAGQVEYRTDKSGVVHGGIGKISFKEEDLLANCKSFVSAIMAAKPTGLKGAYLKSIYVSSTMGPSLRVDLSTITN